MWHTPVARIWKVNDKTSIPEAYHILIMPSTSRSLHTALRSPPPTHDYQRDGSYIPSMYYPRCCYVLAVQTQGLTFTRTSPAFGGCTSIVSMLSGLPASQATAARQETTCQSNKNTSPCAADEARLACRELAIALHQNIYLPNCVGHAAICSTPTRVHFTNNATKKFISQNK